MIKRGGPPPDSQEPHYSILWVPPDHREPTSLTMSVQGWRFFRIGIVILAGLIVIMFVTWGVFLHRALSYDRLMHENETLKVSVEKLDLLKNKVEEMEILDSQIRRALGSRPGLTQEDRALLRERFRNRQWDNGPSGEESADLASVPTLLPVVGMITRKFSDDPLAGGQGHRGVDFAATSGTPIVASASGRVLFAGWTQQYGYTIAIGHANSYTTFYGHAQALLFSSGDDVKQGEPIGMVGSTGVSTAPHLHFEIWKDGKAVDPLKVLQENSGTFTAK